MIGDKIGLYDVNTNDSLYVEKFVDLGPGDDDRPRTLSYTTASHGRLVVIAFGCGHVTYEVDGAMLDEDADRIALWLDMDGAEAVKLIRENAN